MFDGLALPGPRSTATARWELDPLDRINQGLAGFWLLNEAGGLVARDISPLKRHGTLVNFNSTSTSGWGVSKSGRVLNFDGTDDYVNLGPSVIGQNGHFSAAFRVKYNTVNRAFFGRGLDGVAPGNQWGVSIWIDSSNKLVGYVVTTSAGDAGYGAAGTTTLSAGVEYHVGVVYTEGQTLKVYLNGAEEFSVSLAGTSVLRGVGAETFIGRGENGGGANRYLNGSVSDLHIYNRAINASAMRRLSGDLYAGAIDPAARLFFAVRGATGTTVSLTGIALTSSAGSVEEGIAVAASGSAATSAAGTPTSAIASALAGSAGTASAGTATSAIGMSLTGEALTVSAGSLAYTIGFTLTGTASTAAGGSLTPSGGDVLTTRSLTGIRMTALPGNVRVTGGTRWRPSEAQAVTPPSMVGNTLQPPPRLVGDPASDNRAIQQWLQTLYDHVIKRDNVLGRIADHETRIAAVEANDAEETVVVSTGPIVWGP